MKAVLFIAALSACASSPSEPLHTPRPKPRPPTTSPRWLDEPPGEEARWIVLEQHAAASPTVRHVAVHLAHDPRMAPAITDLGEVPAVPQTSHPTGKQYLGVAAHAGSRWVRVEGEDGILHAVVRALPSAAPLARVELGSETPAAMHLVRDALWIGLQSRVAWADLSRSAPELRVLVDRGPTTRKLYDVFARLGDRLLAVDDIIRPMYADWFSLDPRGSPLERLGDWTLPVTLTYAHVTDATVSRSADYAVFVTAEGSSRRGKEQALYRLSITDDKLREQGIDGYPPQVRESDGSSPRLLAGAMFTPWTGMALVPDERHVALAAGERGLLLVSSGFHDTTRMGKLVDVGAPVRDVLARGGTLFALVDGGDGASELLVLERREQTFEVAAHHPLPGVMDRFVE